MEIESLSLKELKDLRTQVDRAISTFEDRRKREAAAELEAKARELGFSLQELLEAAPARKRSASAPKYANPANPADTWTGRGRKPRWFSEALEAGRTKEDLEL